MKGDSIASPEKIVKHPLQTISDVRMFVSASLQFCLTSAQLAKSKADRVVVLCTSVATGHGRMKIRPRLADKLEFVDLDPTIQRPVLYKEDRKVRSVRDHQLRTIPRLLFTNNVHSKYHSIHKMEE